MNDTHTTTPFFSVILLNWNGAECLEACLASLAAQSFRCYELICIDNASTDPSREWLQSHSLEKYIQAPAQCIFNNTNTGFAAGMNTGIRRAKGSWILPLNVDTELADDFFENAYTTISENPEYAMIGPHIFAREKSRTDTTLCTGVWLTHHMSIRTFTESDFADSAYTCFGPAGCAPLISYDALQTTALPAHLSVSGKTEFYDERYFAYGEDVDLYFRMNIYGYTCLYAPDLHIWHRHSATQKGIKWTAKDTKTLARLPANAFATLCKNAPLLFFLSHFFLIAVLPLIMSARLLLSRPAAFSTPLFGYFITIRQLPVSLRLRKYIQSHRSTKTISHFLTPDTHY